ncbi:hypothetical protein HNQ91_002006 [Filimonas zeae]|uniref:Uncharacterized protein n=1 Tax=Filimonas zeae TaxID=1737353 RepID=A0A917MWY8_9BACT|nr:hypothetical protein [Filimonas zeae]MDR6338955.1 hypothetical protein [Filimonas zeae]GGH65790.1 hypothetical protein GCM10011379_19310 [Filimonas zeae]
MLCSVANAQKGLLREETGASFTQREPLVYSPRSLFSEATIAAVTFANGQKGVELALVKGRGKKWPPVVDLAKMVMKSNQTEVVTTTSIKDSGSFKADKSIYRCALYKLTEQQIQLIKNAEYLEIMFTVNNKPYAIRIKRHSLEAVKKLFAPL